MASNSSDGPGVLDEKEKVGPTYTCGFCAQKFYKSVVYIVNEDPSIDWQGGLDFICKDCYNEECKTDFDRRAWAKKCRVRWNERAERTMIQYQLKP